MENYETETQERDFKREKRKVLIVMAAIQVGATIAILVLAPFPAVGSALTILAAIAWSVGILFWVKIDSDERGEEISSGFRIAIIILGVFALAYYLIRTRGFLNGLKAIGWSVLFLIGIQIVNIIIAIVIVFIFTVAGLEPSAVRRPPAKPPNAVNAR